MDGDIRKEDFARNGASVEDDDDSYPGLWSSSSNTSFFKEPPVEGLGWSTHAKQKNGHCWFLLPVREKLLF